MKTYTSKNCDSLKVYNKVVKDYDSDVDLLKNKLNKSLIRIFLNTDFKNKRELFKHIKFLLKCFNISYLYTDNKKYGIEIGGVDFYKNPYAQGFVYVKNNKSNYDRKKEKLFTNFCLNIIKHKQVKKVYFQYNTTYIFEVTFYTNLE